MMFSDRLLNFKAMSCFCLTLVAGAAMTTASFAGCREPSGDGFLVKGTIALQVDKNLEWKRCALGMHWSNEEKTCLGEPWGGGLEQAQLEATSQGNGWRVPSAEEFDNIFMDSCSGPKIDTVVFPGIEASDFGDGAEFWTVTPFSVPGMYYYFNVTHGYVDAHSAGFSLSSLLVRNRK